MTFLTPEDSLFLWIVFAILFVLLPTLALYHLFQSGFKTKNSRLFWVFVIFLMPVVGAMLYFLSVLSIKNRSNKSFPL
ncbi:PLDc N-terminal domain-containing protein [Arcicella rigui]|uniref:PLDc N-terminal domain-containing protein n=1 Tax=Arcicella rigui TaxID=797020 RepID=A0ABU5Q568_9BACT|nr:PLDc N-terminal domain-containing protein [Arcicella rigui]MEA5137965.1 PLDc N-terminal domain-containing protein [Arcicella rigui]